MNGVRLSLLYVTSLCFFSAGCGGFPFDNCAPFDGTWKAVLAGGNEESKECAIEIELDQHINGMIGSSFRYAGEAKISLSCSALPNDIPDLGLPSTLEADIETVMQPGGYIFWYGVLFSNADSVIHFGAETTSEEKGGVERINKMSGTYTLYVDQNGINQAVVQGAFDAERSE